MSTEKYALRDGETIIRDDPVVWGRGAVSFPLGKWPQYRGGSPIGRMRLTTHRIQFLRLAGGNWLELGIRGLWRAVFPMLWRAQVELSSVTKVWTWQPPRSFAPTIEAGLGWSNSYTFMLLIGTYPDLRLASVDETMEHLAVVETAVDTARTRAHLPFAQREGAGD